MRFHSCATSLLIVVACCIHLLLLCSPLPVYAIDVKAALTAQYKEGEVLVRFKDETKASKALLAVKASSVRAIRRIKAHHIRLPPGTSVATALEQFRDDPNVVYAEPNYRVRKLALPNDPLFGNQWNMAQISAPSAWNSYTGPLQRSNSLIVAILDTGIIYTHPDLTANLWVNPGELCGNGLDDDGNGIVDDCYGANFGGVRRAGDPWDDDTSDTHGTQLAGIVGAVGNNGIGIAGVNWSVRLMAVKFMHGPTGEGDLSDALLGMEYAIENGAKVINMSFEVGSYSAAMRDAIVAAEKAGVLVVSAAGNLAADLDSTSVYPASIRTANNIVVIASNATDSLASYSNYGLHTTDIAAPGGMYTGSPSAILSTVWLYNSVYYRTTAGTSLAVPHVTGAAALAWNLNPNQTAAQVRARIMNGVDQLDAFRSATISGGRLNLGRVLTNLDLPAVFSVVPYSIPAEGGTITITGANFGFNPGTVALGSTPLVATSWSDTSITAAVPASAANGKVLVNGSGSGFPVKFEIGLSHVVHTDVDPQTVTITANLNPATTYTKYEWDLGSGSYASIPGVAGELSHTFEASGTYLVRLRVTDSLGQVSIASTTITLTSSSSGGGGGGGGCFIATAAWGSPLHPKVALLRAVRDRYLLTNGPGRLFVKMYYAVSPPVADYIRHHETARGATRFVLTPLVLCIEHPLYSVVGILFGLACLWSLWRRAQQNC